MQLSVFLFYAVALLTALCAIAVVVTQNIVRAAAWLLFALAGTAGIFFFLGADFVGATQILVYVGGTLVLVVFAVMLTAQGPFVVLQSGPAEWAITVVVGLLLFVTLAITTWSASWPKAPPASEPNLATSRDTVMIAQGFLTEGGPIHEEAMGPGMPPRRVSISYLLPFEIVSVHLLVVLIGAAYLARAKRRRGAIPS